MVGSTSGRRAVSREHLEIAEYIFQQKSRGVLDHSKLKSTVREYFCDSNAHAAYQRKSVALQNRHFHLTLRTCLRKSTPDALNNS